MMPVQGGLMKVEIEVSDEMIGNLLTNAFEGGSNYWYQIVRQKKPQSNPEKWVYRSSSQTVFPHIDYPMNGGHLVIKSVEEPEGFPRFLNRKVIARGLQDLANSKDYRHHFADILKEDDDQITADVFLQFCLYGDVLYS
jgi:hypothetical protein